MKRVFAILFSIIGLSQCVWHKSEFNNSSQSATQAVKITDNKAEQNNENELLNDEQKLNPNCIYNIEKIEVFQTLNKYSALAEYYTQDDYLSKVARVDDYFDGVMFYDGLKINVPKGKCVVIKDTYTYESKGQGQKTVPVITFEHEYEPRTMEEYFERVEKSLTNSMQKICSFANEDEMKKEGFKNLEHCRCYVNTVYDTQNTILIGLEDNTQSEKDKKYKQLEKQAEQKCGKLITKKK